MSESTKLLERINDLQGVLADEEIRLAMAERDEAVVWIKTLLDLDLDNVWPETGAAAAFLARSGAGK